MKFSENWLREWVNPELSTDEIVEKLTMAGLEVDSVESCGAEISGVVIGEIVGVEAHPDAEKLRVCRVVGHADGEKQVVCGAPNARIGIKIPFATVGAKLPGGMKIKKAKLRGVPSFGMLCGQTELALGDDDSGLWELPDSAPVGDTLVDWLKLDDTLIEVDLTPNRGDCLSIRGLAREVGVLSQAPVVEPAVESVKASVSDAFPVELKAGAACPHYVGRVIKGVDLTKASPVWMVEKLRRSGIRSIDPVVDVTNYILIEMGQPMHAFDLSKLSDGITVRYANPDEKLTLLNEQTLTLRSDTLVIADQKTCLAVAGVMGGVESSVSTQTRDIFLESAFFAPERLAGKARSYGLHTDSSHRFERGVDWQLQRPAIERATQLLLDIVGGQAGPLVECCLESEQPAGIEVTLTRKRISSCLLIDPDSLDIPDLMARLGLSLQSQTDEDWTFRVPSYRFDIKIEEDLLEEVARVYGYDRLPSRAPSFAVALENHSEINAPVRDVKQALAARGYQEIITYSFIDPELHKTLFGDAEYVALRNPISSELGVMRCSLLPGLIGAADYNLKRQQSRVTLFEVGMVFEPNGNDLEALRQSNKLAGLVYGSRYDVSWAQGEREADFFDVKGDLEAVLSLSARGKAIDFQPLTSATHLHPGQSAEVLIDGDVCGYIGALHPSLSKSLGFNKVVWVFEVSIASVLVSCLPKYQKLSKFPEVTRDLAVVVDKAVCVAQIENAIRKVAGSMLKELKLFDVYSGEGIDPKGKSLGFSLSFQHLDRTLTDDEIGSAMTDVVSQLGQEFGATLR